MFSITPALVLLIVAEVLSLLTIERRVHIQPQAEGRGAVYTMRVGRWPWSRRSVTHLNSQGFPDAEFLPAYADDGCTRIVFTGDSYFFGDGVDRDSSFVSILGRRVAQRTDSDGPCVRIFNVAERGTTIDRQRRKVLETFDQLRPHIVILGQYQNDLMDLTNPGASLGPSVDSAAPRLKPRRVPVPLPSLNINFIKWLTYHSMAFSIAHGIKRDELRRWSVLADTNRRELATRLLGEYRRHYSQLVEDLAARGSRLGVVIMPSKLDLLAGRFPEEAFFTGLARERGVPTMSTFPVMDAQRSPFAFLIYDGHLNERGNRLVADALYDWLFRELPPPFPVLRQRDSAVLAAGRR